MTTTDSIWIDGFEFEWAEFECLRGLSGRRNDLGRFGCVAGRFGVYIFTDGTHPLYIGMSGKTVDQPKDLKERIGQYFQNAKSSGVTFPDKWMKEKEGRSYEKFKNFIAGCKLVTLSIEKVSDQKQENLVGDDGIIAAIERFLIYKLAPRYNVSYKLVNREEENILCSLTRYVSVSK